MKDIASFNNGITYRGRSTITGQFLMILHGQPTRDAFQFRFTIWKFAKTPLVTLVLSNTSGQQETIHHTSGHPETIQHTSGHPETIHHTADHQRTIQHILGLPKTTLHIKVRPGANAQVTNQHIINHPVVRQGVGQHGMLRQVLIGELPLTDRRSSSRTWLHWSAGPMKTSATMIAITLIVPTSCL